jgi:hypothetical protein
LGFCETRSILRDLDRWIRRRLRALAWKQWRRGRTRFAELLRCGVGRDVAAKTAGSPHRPWPLRMRILSHCYHHPARLRSATLAAAASRAIACRFETDELTVPLEDAPLNPRTTFAGWAWTDDEVRCP